MPMLLGATAPKPGGGQGADDFEKVSPAGSVPGSGVRQPGQASGSLPGSTSLDAFLAKKGFTGPMAPRRRRLRTSYPLHAAAAELDVEMVEVLLLARADPTSKNSVGQTAEELVRRRSSGCWHGGCTAGAGQRLVHDPGSARNDTDGGDALNVLRILASATRKQEDQVMQRV